MEMKIKAELDFWQKNFQFQHVNSHQDDTLDNSELFQEAKWNVKRNDLAT